VNHVREEKLICMVVMAVRSLWLDVGDYLGLEI